METAKENKDSDTGAAKRKNVGVKVNETIWRQFRALAISQGMTAGDLLDTLMIEYVTKSRSEASNQGS